MAVNNDHRDNTRDDNRDSELVRDPRLARLLEAASSEAPPAALDAAILAVARRAVHARPQVAGGGGEGAAPALRVRVKRNWYVPVSIAAVLVMSASLVMVVREETEREQEREKANDIARPPRQASVPADASAKSALPSAAPASTPEAAPVTAAPGAAPLASTARQDGLLRDAGPAQPKLVEKTEATRRDAPVSVPEVAVDLSKKQRLDKAEAAAAVGGARKDKGAVAASREMEAAGNVAAAPAVPPPPAPQPFPAQASRDAVETRARSEADRTTVRGTMQQAPPDAPPAMAVVPGRAAPMVEAVPLPAAPAVADSRVQAAPPSPALAAKPASALGKSAIVRAPAWRGLEDQAPEKWLERVTEFKRDGRLTEVDELMVEFRRRFPDHPASVR